MKNLIIIIIIILTTIIMIIIMIIIIIIIIIIIKTYNKTPVGETECISISFLWGHYLVSPALHPGFSDSWRSPPALSSTPTQGFFDCLRIQFFNSLTCDSWDTMPPQRSLTLLSREVQEFPRDDSHFKHVPPPRYLIYLSHKQLYVMGLFKRYRYLAMKCNVS